MEVVYIICVGFVFLVVKMIYDSKNNKEKLKYKLMNQFGKVPTWEYTAEKFESIKKYYDSKRDDKVDVDDITWNDIDMDDIYMLMNNTCTSMGEEYLYAMLRKLQYNDEQLKTVDQLADYFSTHKEERLKLQIKLSNIGRTNIISVYEYINVLDRIKDESVMKHALQAVGVIAALCLVPVSPAIGLFGTIGMLAFNMITYFKSKMKIEAYLNIVSYISHMLTSIDDIHKDCCEIIKPMMDEVYEAAKKFKEFKRGAVIVGGGVSGGNIADIIMDYWRMLFHIDIIQFYRIIKIFRKHRDELNLMYEKLGLIDACIAVASFRKMLPYYVKPVLFSNNKPSIEVDEVYHVMIENPVVNSLHEKRSVLITGSNASGKSTFIKTLAINAILSQTIYTSLSKNYTASYFNVASSMALRDNIFSQESYYIVEIKSLKRIMDRLNSKYPLLCFVDEVLRGTNTLERIAASSEILCGLSKANALCFAATHDIELTHILEDYYSNYHFQEQIVDNNILFDYKLYEGRAVSKNAIKLLSMIGYSKDIIQKATNAANHFLTTGEWEKIGRR